MGTNRHHKPKDLPCIWMLAGIVNYKICNHDYQCETCEFNRVMQGMLSPEKEMRETIRETDTADGISHQTSRLTNQYLHALFSGCKIHLDRCYHSSHLWYKARAANRIQVGIDKLILKLLHPIDRLILPEVGATYRRGQLIAWIVRGKEILPFHSPVEGRVSALHPELQMADPSTIADRDDYLFEMEGKNLGTQVQQFCGHMEGFSCIRQKIGILRSYLVRSFDSDRPGEMGVTLADGGETEVNLEKVIGKQMFDRLIRELFHPKEMPGQTSRFEPLLQSDS